MIHLKVLDKKKAQLDRLQPFPDSLVKNLEEWFKIELTYTSNAIEGNTLSRQETVLVVEKGLTVEGKTIREHLEALNHAEALEWIKTLASKKNLAITEHHILQLHSIILKKIDDINAGRYRNVSVRIAGSTVVMPNPAKVHTLMQKFISWLHSEKESHPVKIAADAHFKFVSIHPFTDGNGRTARLLMNLLLMQAGFPQALIRKEDRLQYINSIEKAQLGGDLHDYYQIIYTAVNRSCDIYLESLEKKEKIQPTSKENLLKIGELAKAVKEPVSTIRYWTYQGLLNIAKRKPNGYQYYHPHMIKRAHEIRRLQKEKRLTVNELKEALKDISV